MPFHSTPARQALLILEIASQSYAVPAGNVDRIIPLAAMSRAPQFPDYLFGFLNLEGVLVPVISLHQLFRMPQQPLGLWTPVVVVRIGGQRRAILVDKVRRIMSVDAESLLQLPPRSSVNECLSAVLRVGDAYVLVLCLERLLLDEENRATTELQRMMEQRLCLTGEGVSL
jgi:chemotaxis signal transduction protein